MQEDIFRHVVVEWQLLEVGDLLQGGHESAKKSVRHLIEQNQIVSGAQVQMGRI